MIWHYPSGDLLSLDFRAAGSALSSTVLCCFMLRVSGSLISPEYWTSSYRGAEGRAGDAGCTPFRASSRDTGS